MMVVIVRFFPLPDNNRVVASAAETHNDLRGDLPNESECVLKTFCDRVKSLRTEDWRFGLAQFESRD